MTSSVEPDLPGSVSSDVLPSASILTCPPPTDGGRPALPRLLTIAVRADFLRAASARRQAAPGFLLQARDRRDATAILRAGYTCSKKVGNAVARNRAKRRLREIARAVLPRLGRPGWDYVLVGRPGVTGVRDFADLLADLEQALSRIHGSAR